MIQTDHTPRRRRILLSAYACEPGKGSEPEVGWQWAICLGRIHDVTVLTRANNRAAIEGSLKQLQGSKPHFEYYDLPTPFLWLKRKGMPVALYYLLWQIGVRWKYQGRLRDFDIIHHITFNSFRQPGFWWFCKTPVVLGPLGGGQICPWAFFPLMRGRRVAEFTRSCSVIATPLLLQVMASFAGATKILSANRDTEKRIPGIFKSKVHRLLETGISSRILGPTVPEMEDPPDINLLWLSWLIPIKAPELALRAFALARKSNSRLKITIAGDGPLRESLESLADDLRIRPFVTWRGRIPREDVPLLFTRHHIFMFTSLRDTSGNVLLEAMAAGLPAVTLAHQGAAEIATDDTAIRICPVSIDQTVRDISQAMLMLAASPELRARMGKAARERIRSEFLWERKAEQMTEFYESIWNSNPQCLKVSQE